MSHTCSISARARRAAQTGGRATHALTATTVTKGAVPMTRHPPKSQTPKRNLAWAAFTMDPIVRLPPSTACVAGATSQTPHAALY